MTNPLPAWVTDPTDPADPPDPEADPCPECGRPVAVCIADLRAQCAAFGQRFQVRVTSER